MRGEKRKVYDEYSRRILEVLRENTGSIKGVQKSLLGGTSEVYDKCFRRKFGVLVPVLKNIGSTQRVPHKCTRSTIKEQRVCSGSTE